MDIGIHKQYGDRLRVRVCGLCWDGDNLLLVNHRGLSPSALWAPPGGGLEFGESVDERLRKEFVEETGLEIAVGRFAFACEFIQHPLHAIELFFSVSLTGGKLVTGDDPELPIIEHVQFMSTEAIAALPPASRHGIFNRIADPEELRTLTGFFTI